ncbi:uncharacterized protein PV09_02791 [Verruconis gallopava]|uniref:Uncharacterized protein n=1 Tax=Verruconis gallopava TaxID=253628 RepID=A0A0D2AHC9_9PEZI|nr:uncharacterized protein PV09_02791 [Verruconis gallopava]KIW06328.1 hypothetical protein PV09_02791 [Verruconis gallopava]
MADKNPISEVVPQQEKKQESWGDWGRRNYNEQYEAWVPWMEDKYLQWFGKDNKASYVAKDQLDKSKVTGVKQVDKLQDDVNNLAAGQVGKGGLLQPVGDMASKEGINRAERGGKDSSGSYAPGALGDVANPVADGVKGAGSTVMESGKSAGGYVKGLWGGKK